MKGEDIKEFVEPKKFREMLKGKKIVFMCCFCGKGVEKPLVCIEVSHTGQIYWSHRECFKKRLTKTCQMELKR